MKNMKFKTRLIIGFVIPVVLTIINTYFAISSTKGILNAPDQDRYYEIAVVFYLCVVAVAIAITVLYGLSVVRVMRVSLDQLSDAAQRIAQGHVDIELVKHNNDEFGDLIDEYKKVVDNIKYQAGIAEEVSKGNLTVMVNPRSADDLLGHSLKKLVEDNNHVLSSISDAAYQVTIGSSRWPAQASPWHRVPRSRPAPSSRLPHPSTKWWKRPYRMQSRPIRRRNWWKMPSRT